MRHMAFSLCPSAPPLVPSLERKAMNAAIVKDDAYYAAEAAAYLAWVAQEDARKAAEDARLIEDAAAFNAANATSA